MTRYHQYLRGTVLLFTTGEYSDFGMCGELVTIKDIDLKELVEAYRDETNPKRGAWEDNPDGFAGWLIAKGYAMPLDAETVHLGSYGSITL